MKCCESGLSNSAVQQSWKTLRKAAEGLWRSTNLRWGLEAQCQPLGPSVPWRAGGPRCLLPWWYWRDWRSFHRGWDGEMFRKQSQKQTWGGVSRAPPRNMACYLSISVIIPHHLPDTVLTSIIHLLLTIAKDRGAKPSSLWWFPKQEAAGKRKKHCFIPAWNHSCSLVRRMHVSKKVQTRECQTCTRCETHMCTRSSMQVKTMHGIHRRNRDRGSRNQKHLNGMFKTFQNIACT